MAEKENSHSCPQKVAKSFQQFLLSADLSEVAYLEDKAFFSLLLPQTQPLAVLFSYPLIKFTARQFYKPSHAERSQQYMNM